MENIRLRKGSGKRKWAAVLIVLLVWSVSAAGCKKDGTDKKELRLSGIEKLNAGDYAGAVTDFDQAIQTSKGKVGSFEMDVLKYRAEAEYMLGDYGAAAHTYDVLLEVDGEEMEYFYQNAVMKALSGDIDGALAAYGDGVRLEKEGSKKSGLSSLFGLLDKEPSKESQAASAETSSPQGKEAGDSKEQEKGSHTGSFGRREALMAVGNACLEAGREEEAKKLFDAAMEEGAAGPEVYFNMGMSFLENQQYTEALDAFESAILRGTGSGLGEMPADPQTAKLVREARFNQAVIYEYQGLYKNALEAFEAYVAEYGPDEAAQREITFLQTR
ncbi:MAG: tetratricopeptide repeat protein [Lachnospiraceae bacterium]|jgi:tetratricopeptide (TPR) repeat protein|nr:tetratricopeptide repeat protein [Lachnospiraceae bacterium]